MFLDMKSSTTLAETLGGQQYFSLLNTFFRDISEPILERGAEIYQYIGDEVVLTWPVESGFWDANCIRVFFEILAEIEHRVAQRRIDRHGGLANIDNFHKLGFTPVGGRGKGGGLPSLTFPPIMGGSVAPTGRRL